MQNRKKDVAVATPASAPEKRMYTVSEAAQYLGSTEWYVRTLVWERKIPHLTFGKRHVFDKADLDAFIESQKVRAA